MVTRYINDKTTNFYKNSTVNEKDYILIYGDELELTGNQVYNRIEVIVRDRKGWVRKDEVGDEPLLEIYYIDVGQGDSTFIVTPNRKKYSLMEAKITKPSGLCRGNINWVREQLMIR